MKKLSTKQHIAALAITLLALFPSAFLYAATAPKHFAEIENEREGDDDVIVPTHKPDDAVTATGSDRVRDYDADDRVREVLRHAEVHVKGGVKPSTPAQTSSATTTEVTSAKTVSTAEGLSSFVAYTVAHDPRLSSVDLSGGAVSLSYTFPAHYFGFIATSISATVTSDASGTIAVSYPWQHLFMSTDHSASDIQKGIQSAVDTERANKAAAIAALGSAARPVNFNVSELFELITRTLKASF